MSVIVKTVQEILQVFIEHGVTGDHLLEPDQLLFHGQLAVQEQIGDLEKTRLGRELLDRIAPIEQDPVLAVDVGDGAVATGGGHETGVVREDPGLLVERGDIRGRRADAAGA